MVSDRAALLNQMPKKIMLIAGEASADLHASALILKLRELDPEIEVYGVGGENSRKAGARIWFDFSRMGVVGILEAIPKLRFFLKARARLSQSIETEKPDLVILLDLPDFNLSLAKKIKKKKPGQKIAYYISPQVWAWRGGRVKIIRKYIDQMLVIFPFEEEFYRQAGVPVKFVGHPLLARVRSEKSREQLRAGFGVKPDELLLVFMPGSRKEELKVYLPPALAGLERLQKEFPLRAMMPLAPTLSGELVQSYLSRSRARLEVVSGKTYDLLFAGDLGLIGSGTATLEAALAGLPMLILARSSTVNYWLARFFVHTEFYGLPNLIAGKEIAKELFMYQVNPDQIYLDLKKLIASPEQRARMKSELIQIRGRLGEKDASAEAGRAILAMIKS